MAIITPLYSDSLKEGRSSFEEKTPEMQRTNAFTIEFLSAMHTYLFDEITKIHSRMDALQFTRERSLTFPGWQHFCSINIPIHWGREFKSSLRMGDLIHCFPRNCQCN